MPRVTIRTGFMAADGREEELIEFLCDAPDCPNVATQVLGCVKELGLVSAMCDEHAALVRVPKKASGRAPESAS